MMPHWDEFKWVRMGKERILVDGKFGLGLYGTGRAPAMGGLQGHLSFKRNVPQISYVDFFKFLGTENIVGPTAWEFQISKHLILENSSFVWKYLLIKYLQDERRNHLPTSAIRAKRV